jgi:hypothetical protein
MELEKGVPLRVREYLGEVLVSETSFFQGRPQFQIVDLDLDGRLETVRRFRRTPPPLRAGEEAEDDLPAFFDQGGEIEYAESDWDGDGIFESRQYY